jgi:glycosyltransferase involved in cell wall biosynthesis
VKSICFVVINAAVRGGLENVTTSLANELSDYYKTHIVSIYTSPGDKFAYEADQRVTLTSLGLPTQRLTKLRRAVKEPLADYINKNNIDIVFLEGNYTGFVGSSIKKSVKAKLVFADHGSLKGQSHDKKTLMCQFIASHLCDKTVLLTERNRKDYIRTYHLPPKKAVCIHNWIDPDVPCSQNYDINSKRIISAGRLAPEKQFDLLIKAFEPVYKKHPDWHLDIYGDGPLKDTLEELIKQLNLEENVHLMGMRTDLAQQYGKYSFYVLSSYREGLPLVLLEAKSNRLPIISFNIPTGPEEIITDGVDGFLVAPYNIKELSNKMNYLIENPGLRISMSEKSQNNLDKFSKTTILKQWIDLLESF